MVNFIKYIFILILSIISSLVSATTYYVSSVGNDNANGTSTSTSWATLSKVNAHTFVAGDNILFNRGDTWYGTLTISQSGTSNSRIIFGAYGSGAKPIITGFTTISGWTNVGNGVYSKAVSIASAPLNMVTVNGVNTGKGRYPKEGNWLTNSSVGTGTITAANMPSTTINWAANGTANIFMKTEGYRWNHGLITSHSGNVINYTQQSGWCGGNGYAGWGFFIDNDIRTLSTVNGVAPQLGEWFYNTSNSTFYMYFGTGVDPATKIVKVASLDFGVICHQSYITVDNISFLGFNGDYTSYSNGAVNLGDNSQYVSVTNCEVGFIGASAIWIGTHTTIDNCWVHDVNGTAFLGVNSYLTLTNNTIENIGLIYSSMGGWCARGCAMDISSGTNDLIQYNIFRHIGSFCVKTNGTSNVTIDKNLFDDCVIRAIDAGCIYVNGESPNRVISNNICVNTGVSLEGIIGTLPDIWYCACSIYLDTPNDGITVTGNTCAGTKNGPGIMISAGHENTISNNTLYNNLEGFEILSTIPTSLVANLQFTNNKIIAASAGQFLTVVHVMVGSLPNFGFTTASGDIYARLIDDGVDQDWLTLEYDANNGYTQYRTYASWLSRSGETNSTFSSVTTSSVNNIHFIYNASKSNKVVALDGGYLDIKGTKYSGSITLLPYTSAVLMPDPNPSASSASPAYGSSAIENATPNILTMTYNMSLANIAPASSAFSVKVNTVSRTVNAVLSSGTTIKLTLSSAIKNGESVTVAYTKPSLNPIQTPSGGQAATISAQTVTNKVSTTPAIPQYVSSTIADATPTLIELVYSLTMANVLPDVAAFSVRVNSISQNIQSVSISGASVFLTLANEVGYGDNVTIAYTQPATSALMATSGILVATMSVQSVTNKVSSVGPIYVSSAIENITPGTLEITYDETLDLSVPSASAFVVMVNGVKRNVTSVSISGNNVLLTLANPVVYGDVITVSYIKPTSNQLKKATGETAVSFSLPQPVTNKLAKSSIKKEDISVYPNPAREFVNISILETSLEPQILRIIDLSGKLCIESRLNAGTNNKVLINIKSGIYIVQVLSGSVLKFVQKLIVM